MGRSDLILEALDFLPATVLIDFIADIAKLEEDLRQLLMVAVISGLHEVNSEFLVDVAICEQARVDFSDSPILVSII